MQDKQIAHYLGISTQKMSNIRNGSRYLTETEALFLAEAIGADKETVLVYLAADKAKTYEAHQAWANKWAWNLWIFNGLCRIFCSVYKPIRTTTSVRIMYIMLNKV